MSNPWITTHEDADPVVYLVDGLLTRYVEWHADAEVVAAAYRRWSSASRNDKAACFSSYFAALDQEEAAAEAYARAISGLKQWLRRLDG